MKQYLVVLIGSAALAAAEVPGRLIEIVESFPSSALEQVAEAVGENETEVARQVASQIEQVQLQLTDERAKVKEAQGRVADTRARVIELAQAVDANPTLPRSVSTTGIRLGGGRGSADAVVIRFSEPETQAQAELEEDLAVMARVLDKAVSEQLGEERRHRAMGIEVFLSATSKSPRAYYLEDYGAVFLLDVPLPLLPPPEQTEMVEKKAEIDAAWEEARRELYGAKPFLEDVLGKALQFEVHGETWPDYDAKKVDELKEALLEALKNARNIRGLKPEEWITVCVLGGPGGNTGHKRVVHINKGEDDMGTGVVTKRNEMVLVKGGERSAVRSSLLTIRIRKSDADAFGAGELDVEALEERAKTALYPAGTSAPKETLGVNWAR